MNMDWTNHEFDDRPTATATRRSTFVAPPPAQLAPLAGYMPTVNLPAPVVVLEDDGHYAVQRAKGFAIRTSMLGAGFGLAAATLTLIVLIGRAGSAITALIVLAVLFATFAGVWAYALTTEIRTSPGGIARRHADGLWRFVEREQNHLHRIEEARWKP